MEEDTSPQPKKARTIKSKPKSVVADGISTQDVRSVMDDPQTLITSQINTIFQNAGAGRKALTNNLKDRSTTSSVFTERAQQVFASFNPSRFSARVQASPNYLGPHDDLTLLQKTLLNRGIKSIRKSDVLHSITVVESEALARIIKQTDGPDGVILETIDLNDLLSYINSKARGRDFFRKDKGNVVPNCRAEVEADRRMKAILDSRTAAADASVDSSGAAPPASEGDDSSAADSDTLRLAAAKLVQDNVDLQMRKATSPESKLEYSIPNTSDQTENLHNNVQTFELRIGASDVTAYHDFYNLQIAFEHVWEEMFDARLASLGKQLYEEYVKLKDINGLDDGADPTISTIEDLKRLMDQVKTLTLQTVQNAAPMTNSATPGMNPTNTPGDIAGTAGDSGGAGVAAGAAGVLAAGLGLDPLTAAAVGLLGKLGGWW